MNLSETLSNTAAINIPAVYRIKSSVRKPFPNIKAPSVVPRI